jgi:hypothetical protein
LFCGNAGNAVTGFNDSSGQPLNQFGSNDTTLEGFFDLGGLQIPMEVPARNFNSRSKPSIRSGRQTWSLTGRYK